MMQPEDLVYWIHERERVRLNKEANVELPWSDDPVFQNTYFCNVRREDDKVTKWIAESWRYHLAEVPEIVPAMVLARMFNLPSHLAKLDPFLPGCEKNKRISKGIKGAGGKVFNGAYIITTCGRKMDKIDYVYAIVRDVTGMEFSDDSSLDSCHADLMAYNGLGSFLAAQVIADLKNTPGHPLQRASDWWTWCAPGPGSLKGIRCIEGYENTSEGSFLHAATRLYATCQNRGLIYPLHMQDFQNCLCEFSKYVRVKGGGRSKRKYHGL